MKKISFLFLTILISACAIDVTKKEMRKLLFNMVLTNEISEEAMHKILDMYYITGYGRK